MSDYSNTFGGAAKDAANSTILGTDFDTEFDAIATASATKANKTGAPATTNNLAMLDSNGDLADSLIETDGSGNFTGNITGNLTGDVAANSITIGGTEILTLVGSATASGDVATLEVTGLSGNSGAYILEAFITAPSSGAFLDLRINQNTTATNYDYRRSIASASSEAYAAANDHSLGWSTTGTGGAYIKAEFMGNSTAGIILGMMQLNTYTSNTQMYQYSWAYTATGTISALGFGSSSGSAIGNGSVLRVYKRSIT